MRRFLAWDYFVDAVTVVWLILFVLGLTNTIEGFDLAVKLMLTVFVADLVVKYRREPDLRTFLRTRWIDILPTIPWFRASRILRFLRLPGLLKIGLQAERFRRRFLRLLRRLWRR